MKQTLTSFLSLCPVVWLVACGTTEADPLKSVGGFCNLWGQEVCTESVVGLCGSPSTEQCQLKQSEFCVDQLSDGSYQGEGAQECLTFIHDIYRDSAISRKEREALLSLGPPCDGLLSGEGNAGDECDEDKDCATAQGFECIERLPEEGRHCHVPELVEGGGRCQDEASVCIEGQYCNGSNCIAKATEGDECSAAIPCEDSSRCVIPSGETVGECEPRAKNGTACRIDSDCASNLCDRNADEEEGYCVTYIGLDVRSDLCALFR